MAPLVRRSWAHRGQRPVLQQRGQHREKVSLAAALYFSPQRKRLGLYYQTLINGYFDSQDAAEFVRTLLRRLRAPLVVVWDNGALHQGNPNRELLGRYPRQITLERLPPYAPMLNPVEPLWSWLKYGRLGNFAPINADHLNSIVDQELRKIRKDQQALRNFWKASQLPFP